MTDTNAIQDRHDYLIDQYRTIHKEKKYGGSSEQQLGYIQRQVADMDIKTILDYGCGQSRLVDWLAKLNDAEAHRYDPAIPEFATPPTINADLVLNTDVLEHVPEESIDDVLAKIAARSDKVYFNISIVEARTLLPDGSNAHCTVQRPRWWKKRLSNHFATVRKVPSYRKTTCSFVTWAS